MRVNEHKEKFGERPGLYLPLIQNVPRGWGSFAALSKKHSPTTQPQNTNANRTMWNSKHCVDKPIVVKRTNNEKDGTATKFASKYIKK